MSFEVSDIVQIIESCKLQTGKVVSTFIHDECTFYRVQYGVGTSEEVCEVTKCVGEMVLVSKGENQFKRNQKVKILYANGLVEATILEPFYYKERLMYRLKYLGDWLIEREPSQIMEIKYK